MTKGMLKEDYSLIKVTHFLKLRLRLMSITSSNFLLIQLKNGL